MEVRDMEVRDMEVRDMEVRDRERKLGWNQWKCPRDRKLFEIERSSR